MAITACAAMAMTSCSSEDLTGGTTKANETPISFSTYLGRNVESRATGVTTDNITEIGVYAAYTGTSDWANTNSLDFMMNQKVTKSTTIPSTDWTYTPLKYWPANSTDKLSFFAYAPYDVADDNMTLTANTTGESSTKTAPTGSPIASFDIADADIAKTPDLVVASVMNEVKPADSKVSFTLRHTMTRVWMKAKVGSDVDAKSKVVVTGVKLTSTDELNTKATFTFPTTDTDNGTWTAETTSAHEIDLAAVLKDEDTAIKGASAKGAILSTTATPIYNSNDFLYLIPANLGKGASAEGAVSVEISYAIVTEDAALANGSVTTTTTKTAKLPKDVFTQGKAYDFTFTIGVDAIVLDVTSVENWGNWNDDETITL